MVWLPASLIIHHAHLHTYLVKLNETVHIKYYKVPEGATLDSDSQPTFPLLAVWPWAPNPMGIIPPFSEIRVLG